MLMVSVEVPPADVMGFGLKFATAPLGKPVAVNVTCCAAPWRRVVEMVLGPLPLP